MPATVREPITGRGTIATYANAFSAEKASKLFKMMNAAHKDEMTAEVVTMRGRQLLLTRTTAFFGNEGTTYRYSGHTRKARVWGTGTIGQAVDKVRRHLCKILEKEDFGGGATFDPSYALVNYYPDGKTSIGAHSDDERDLVPGSSIVSVSFGAERDMMFHPKPNKDDTTKPDSFQFPLASGAVISMRGPLQKHWKHSIPARTRVRTGRFNITLRYLKKTE